jgi:hypothetical protein
MVELRRQAEIIHDMDALWDQLLGGAQEHQRTLSFDLYQAALAVALHGCDEVSGEFAARAATWRAARSKRSDDEKQRFRTPHVVKQSSKARNRGAGGERAYEVVVKSEATDPGTSDKSRPRKPRK